MQGDLPRVGPNHEGVHARGDDHRPQMAGGVRAGLLQVLRPHQAVQVQEEPAPGAALQQVRRTQRLENIQSAQEKELSEDRAEIKHSYLMISVFLFLSTPTTRDS